MLRRLLVACAVLVVSASFSPTQAGIPIPCTGTHVLKATDFRSAADANGQAIVPYYVVDGCSDGRWDGYRTADGKYHQLTPGVLSSIPEAPRFWAAAWQNKLQFWAEWLWILVGAFVVIGTALSKLSGADPSDVLTSGGKPPSVRRG